MARNSVDDDRYNEFDSHERVSGTDIQAIRNTIVFNMTGRQIILTSMAIILTTAILYGIHRTVGLSNTYLILVPLPFAVPLLLLAFYKPLDMHLEDWLQIWYSNNIKSMPVRKLFSENAYEKALKAADLSGKKESGGKNPGRKEKAGGEKKKNRYVLVQ